jgi:hypothetical protein
MFRISATSSISILMVGLGWHLCLWAQVKPKSSSKIPGGDSYASCYDNASGRLVGAEKRRTFVLESPDGKYRGYAKTEAVTRKKENAQGDEDVGCENKTGLFVAGPENQKFRQVMSVLPRLYLSGNSISLVDWSREGHQLLIGEGLWGYGSDFGGTVIRVYDADSGTLTQGRCPANPSLTKHFANMRAKNALVCINRWGFPRMAELLSKQDRISMRANNSRARSLAWLKRVSGLLVPRTSRSGSFPMTTYQNITEKK